MSSPPEPFLMSQTIRLLGRAALSPFRLNKLELALSSVLPGAAIAAEYWHFVSVTRDLNDAEMRRLERLLTYGPKGEAAAERRVMFGSNRN